MKKNSSCLYCLAILIIINASVFAQADHIGANAKIPHHPRILLLQNEEKKIQQNFATDETWKKLHNAIVAEANNIIPIAPVERIQIGRRLLDKSREALRRIFYLSYCWRMTHDKKYLARTEKELLAISKFSDWNPTHFLDVAEMTMAVSIGYDWLYNDLPVSSRTTIADAILKKGIEPSRDAKYNSWLTNSNNWNQVCNAGMTYGALAIYENDPALSKEIINRAIETIVLPMKDYNPDGAYPEGYGYWGYGTSFNVMFISALGKVFGKDFGLSAKPGFLETPRYLENMTGPSGNSFNYSDAGSGGGLQPAMFWFASRLKDPSLLWVEKSRLIKDDPGKFTQNRLLPAVMLWNGGMRTSTIGTPSSTMWSGKGKTPVALMRSSWTDPAAIYVGMKGGSASASHAHMDVGSFIMEANGVRWAMDFGMQEYESLESKGIAVFGRTQDAGRWQIFRYNNLTHNTLTINNEFQKVNGYAPITRFSKSQALMFAITDLSDVYKGSIVAANRGVGIVNKQYVLVRDELVSPAKETSVRWTMLTPATVIITGKNTAELVKDGKKLLLRVDEPASISIKTWTTVPPHDYDAPNPGTTLVGFEYTMPASSKVALTVLLLPVAPEGKAIQKVLPLSEWK